MQTSRLPDQDDRRLLAAVSKWARTNGWATADWRGWRNARWEDAATIAVADNEAGFRVWRKSPDAMFFTGQPTEYPADSVRQAVDMLVALNILPVHFSSAYAAGAESTREVIEAARTLAEAFDFGSHSAQDAAVQALGDAVAAYEIDAAGSAR